MSNARNKKIAALERLKESDNYLDPPPKYVSRIKFKFPEPPKQRRGGGRVSNLCGISRVTHGYGDGADSVLFSEANFSVAPGEKVGIVGRNGSGKSTLLRLLMGHEAPGDGSAMPADPALTGYFTQHQADLLPPEKTPIEIAREANDVLLGDMDLVDLMRKFRFRGNRLNVQAKYLSGGEKARLAIVRMMLTPAQLLVFDEPTNHLDIPMKETLEYSLREFEGAVVVVSHDRWFLSQTCTRMVAIENGQVQTYEGDFRYYMDSNPEVRKKIESHYLGDSSGIGAVPYSKEERKKRARGGLKKNHRARLAQARAEEATERFAALGRRR